MTMAPRVRKFALTAHITASVGWLGAVAGVLALAVAGLASHDPQLVRGAYLVMEPVAWFVLLPLAFASLLTGLVQGLGSKWGLFQHYWVLFKLLINIFATVILLMYMQTLGALADLAAGTALDGGDLSGLRSPSPVLHASAALLLLVVATTLAVYKPRGLTPYGRRKQQEQRAV
jgi:hypothetical protein